MKNCLRVLFVSIGLPVNSGMKAFAYFMRLLAAPVILSSLFMSNLLFAHDEVPARAYDWKSYSGMTIIQNPMLPCFEYFTTKNLYSTSSGGARYYGVMDLWASSCEYYNGESPNAWAVEGTFLDRSEDGLHGCAGRVGIKWISFSDIVVQFRVNGAAPGLKCNDIGKTFNITGEWNGPVYSND